MKVQKSRNPNAPLTLSRLEEMKVSELKEELKQKGQKVNFSPMETVNRILELLLIARSAGRVKSIGVS